MDIFVLKKRLKPMIDKLIPNKRVHDVLIQSVSEGSSPARNTKLFPVFGDEMLHYL